MVRLTFDGNFCDIAQCRDTACRQDGTCTQRQVWERLEAYENTLLSPKEVKLMSNILLDVGTDYNFRWEYVKNWLLNERLHDLYKADKAGRVLILPCAEGTTVYRIRRSIADDPDKSKLEIVQSVFTRYDLFTFWTTVFPTREEAEKALAEMKREEEADGATDKPG